MSRLLIVGGGAAGMAAAVWAAERGMEVRVFEQNEKLGKKPFITGKGRCNFTNACATEELFDAFETNSHFLRSAVYGFTNYDVIDFFENLVFRKNGARQENVSQSDHSSDIILALGSG